MMEMTNIDVQTIEKLVREIVKEVFHSRTSAPSFSGIRTVEKQISVPKSTVNQKTDVQKTEPTSVSVPVFIPPQTPPLRSDLKSDEQSLKSGELLLDKHIVTLRDVEHLPAPIKRLIVPQNAILTPAVRDELEEQHVRIARYSKEAFSALQTNSKPNSRGGLPLSGGLDVYALFTPYHPESLFPVWARSGLHPNLRADGETFEAVRESIAQSETFSVVFTSKADEALCRLHRSEKIRAIRSVNPEKMTEQWKNFSGINTLVVNPSEVGIYMTGRLVQTAAELFYH